jgi:hypothetical protein
MARESRAEAKGSLVGAIDGTKRIAIRAGARPHRFIPLWAVVVEGRVFVRSWSLKPRSWYHALREDPRGVVEVGGRRASFRAAHTRSERLKAAIDRAYLEKYGGPTERGFARDLGSAKSRATTTELVFPHR